MIGCLGILILLGALAALPWWVWVGVVACGVVVRAKKRLA